MVLEEAWLKQNFGLGTAIHPPPHVPKEAFGVPDNTICTPPSTNDVRIIYMEARHYHLPPAKNNSPRKEYSAADNMRVILLGPTGNLGLRCTPALIAHGHVLTVFVRSPTKLRSLLLTELLDRIDAIVVGDATDSAALKKAIIDHDVEAIVQVAGNQVLPWHEYVLPKIVKAISTAALEVRKEREIPLRI